VQQNFSFYIGDVVDCKCILKVCKSLDDENPIMLTMTPTYSNNTLTPYSLASIIKLALLRTQTLSKSKVAQFLIDNFGFSRISNVSHLKIVYEYKLVLANDMYWALLVKKHLKNGTIKTFPTFLIGKDTPQEEFEQLKNV